MFSGISIWQLLIIFAIIVVLFGTKKLRNIGGDLGGAVKGFKDAMRDGEQAREHKRLTEDEPAQQHNSQHADDKKDKV